MTYLPEGFLLCVLDNIQDQDYLFQKAVVLLFVGLGRGEPRRFMVCVGGCREEGVPGNLCPLPLARVIGIGPAFSVEVIPPLLCGQTCSLQGSTHKTIVPFDSEKSFQLR